MRPADYVGGPVLLICEGCGTPVTWDNADADETCPCGGEFIKYRRVEQ